MKHSSIQQFEEVLKSRNFKMRDSLIPTNQTAKFYGQNKSLNLPVISEENYVEFYSKINSNTISDEELILIRRKIRKAQKTWSTSFADSRSLCLQYMSPKLQIEEIKDLVNQSIIPFNLLTYTLF